MLFHKKKGQNTAEYAILIALVVAAGIAMQTYIKRGLQSGVKYAVDDMSNNTPYEPYYLESEYKTTTDGGYKDTEETKVGGGVTRVSGQRTIIRSGNQTIKDATQP